VDWIQLIPQAGSWILWRSFEFRTVEWPRTLQDPVTWIVLVGQTVQVAGSRCLWQWEDRSDSTSLEPRTAFNLRRTPARFKHVTQPRITYTIREDAPFFPIAMVSLTEHRRTCVISRLHQPYRLSLRCWKRITTPQRPLKKTRVRIAGFILRFLTLEDGTDRLLRNVGGNYCYLLHNSPGECDSRKALVFIQNGRLVSWLNQRIYGVSLSSWFILRITGALTGLRSLSSCNCGFSSRQGHECLSLVFVVCCQAEVSPTGRYFVQRIPTKRGVSERNLETSRTMTPRPTRAVDPYKKKKGHWVE